MRATLACNGLNKVLNSSDIGLDIIFKNDTDIL